MHELCRVSYGGDPGRSAECQHDCALLQEVEHVAIVRGQDKVGPLSMAVGQDDGQQVPKLDTTGDALKDREHNR